MLPKKRIDNAKRAFSTRRVPTGDMRRLLTGDLRPEPGDLVLARVDEILKHTKLELTDGRKAHMFPGDEIIVAFGHRYAPDQYEAQIGEDLSPCDLVAAGGLASVEISRHERMLPPTRISPLGLLARADGTRMNLADYGVRAGEGPPPIAALLSLGTSMNAGKTLTAMSMVRGLKRLGHKVAALKITGTGAGGDIWIVRDAGADVVADFTDAGFASTYLTPIEDIERGCARLLNYAADQGCDIAVIEIADGLQQLETSRLIHSRSILDVTLGTVFAAYDAMGAKYGVDVLRAAGHNVIAMSGRLGRSPLGVREAEAATGLRVFSPWELQDGMLIPTIRSCAVAALKAQGGDVPHLHRLARDVLDPAVVRTSNVVNLMSPAAVREEQARAVLTCAIEHVMSAEVDALCGASFGVRGATRKNRRNGFRPRRVATVLGDLWVRVPRLRRGGYGPGETLSVASREAVEAVLYSANGPGFEAAVSALVDAIRPETVSVPVTGSLGQAVMSAIQSATQTTDPTVGRLPQQAAVAVDDGEFDSDLDDDEQDSLDLMNEYGHTRRAEGFNSYGRPPSRAAGGAAPDYAPLRYIPIPGE
nr:transposase [Palleronia rufa]